MISVLYVDDEPMFLDLGKRFLERSGKILVDTFHSADIVVKILSLSSYDAIISDYQMPGMDGIEFLSSVRKINPDIPFIVYTGKSREEIAIKALNEGADLYLQKDGSPGTQYGEIEKFLINIVGREHRKAAILEQKKKAEDTLALLQTLYQYSPIGFAFIDTSSVFIHVNEAMADLNHVSRLEHLGRTVHEVNTDFWIFIEPHVSKVLKTGSAIRNLEMSGDEGSWQGERYSWLITLYPVRTKTNEIIGLGILIVDISAHKMMESALKKSEERYRTLAESAEDTIFIVGRDERLIYINSSGSKILEKRPGIIIGMNVNEPETGLPDLISSEGLRSVFSTGKKYAHEAHINRVNQSLWFEVLLIPMPGYSDQYGQVMGIGRDITRRKKAEARLHTANKKLQLLSSITRHDIINQITYILLHLDDLKDCIGLNREGNQMCDEIKHSVRTIHKQIEFTREYQEIGIGTPIWQNIHAIIQNTIQLFPKNKIAIIEEGTNLEIFADVLFEKVIYNIIDNSIRHGKSSTRMIFHFETRDGFGRLILEDNGQGIEPAEKEKIFEYGFGKNTGFGLFMVRELLAITHMEISEQGTSGKGARFEIVIPEENYRYIHSEYTSDVNLN
jgi:PAS domain S-box-containing protein